MGNKNKLSTRPAEGQNEFTNSENESDYDSDRGCEGRPESKEFMCGVVEGFYGRPWNFNQRIELFRRMKEFGMNTYLYAPKDDIKHRAFWRDLYTVEEADHLTELIKAATSCDVKFIYAISPGLDMTYSSSRDQSILQRKLDQVSSFGCSAFALLFDDIEPEMNKTDKEAFRSFAHAQAAVTNIMYEHLRRPVFLFCPTEYCATRAVPTILNSQYLNTVGQNLQPGIEIMWTGPKVVSKVISPSSIKELTKVIRRPPLIWDNIHANDYDQKRVFLGPFAGRHPALIPLLAGVLTNPNCEFEPNFVAMHTLASWSKTAQYVKKDFATPANKVERETKVESPTDSRKTLGLYNGKEALHQAIEAWLPYMYTATEPDGARSPPREATAPTPVTSHGITGIPASVTTCMVVTPTTQTGGLSLSVDKIEGDITVPAGAPLDEDPMPMEVIPEKLPPEETATNSLVDIQIEAVGAADSMQVDEECVHTVKERDRLTGDDVEMICDMFYLPYEHGSAGLHLLNEFNWLKFNSKVLQNKSGTLQALEQIKEWKHKAHEFDQFYKRFNKVVDKFSKISNRCLLYDLNSYLWDIRGAISLLNSFIKWLDHAQPLDEEQCLNLEFKVQWTSAGYSDAFMSGDNEPWVFRGGLTGELQRLLPLDSSADLFNPTVRCQTDPACYTIRPYTTADEAAVYNVCCQNRTVPDSETVFEKFPKLIPDLCVGGLLTLCSKYCFVVEDDVGVCGYAVGTPDAKEFHRQMSVSWIAEMKDKYPQPAETDDPPIPVQEMINEFFNYTPETSEGLMSHYPGLIRMEFLPRILDHSPKQRTMACLFSALKSVEATGVHVKLRQTDGHMETMYTLLGFHPCNTNILASAEESISSVLCRKV